MESRDSAFDAQALAGVTHTSGTLGFKPAPLSLLPQLITGGILFSLLDVARRIGIEEALKREEADEFNKQLRKDEKNYDL